MKIVPRNQSGNFLLQALLALTCVFAFMPFFVRRMAARDMSTQMYSATRQIDTAATAARIYIRENATQLPYNETVISGDKFADVLESYGLPLGFVPRTALGQDIALVINRDTESVSAYLRMTGGDLSDVQMAEMVRRIGFYAGSADGALLVGIALDDAYSDVVRRNDTDLDSGAFLSDLDMGGHNLNNASDVHMQTGEFETGEFTSLSLFGVESGRKVKNTIKEITADRAIFQSSDGASALSVTKGELNLASLDAKTISAFGDTGNFTATSGAVYDFAMTAGRTGFTGPANWNVRGSVVTSKINFSVERLEINSFLNASRGQDVYINSDSLEYSANSGINVATISASNITMRDQTSDALSSGETGDVVLDIRPAGTSILPDVLISGIDNGTIDIISNPSADDGDMVACKNIVDRLDGVYNQKSLAQYIICQYYFWQRLERRIDIKQCLLNGGGNCDRD